MAAAVQEFGASTEVNGVLVLAAVDCVEGTTLDAAVQNVDVPVFGGLFPEVVHDGSRRADGAVAVGLDVEPTVTSVPGLDDPAVSLRDQFGSAHLGDGHRTAFAFVDAYTDRLGAFVDALFDTFGTEFNVLGGGTGALDEPETASVITDEGVVADAAVFVTVPLAGGVGVRHGWNAVDGPFRVTDATGSTVATLDGEPAYDVYQRVVEADSGSALSVDSFFETAKAYPLGSSRMSEETVIRDPFEVGGDGELECFGPVREGEFVHVMWGDEESLVAAAEEATAAAAASYPGEEGAELFVFDCISRVLYLEGSFDRELAAIGDQPAPAVGALTIGELANDRQSNLEYYNKTAVVAVLGQR